MRNVFLYLAGSVSLSSAAARAGVAKSVVTELAAECTSRLYAQVNQILDCGAARLDG